MEFGIWYKISNTFETSVMKVSSGWMMCLYVGDSPTSTYIPDPLHEMEAKFKAQHESLTTVIPNFIQYSIRLEDL